VQSYFRLNRLWRYPVSGVIVLCSALAAVLLQNAFDIAGLSTVFLTGVILTGVTLGAGPAYFGALLAFAIYNYYLVEPRFRFQLDSAEDFSTLAFFLGVAIVTGGLTGRLRDQMRRNSLMASANGVLFEASRRLSAAGSEDEVRRQLVQQLAAAARGEAVLSYKGQTWHYPLANKDSPFGKQHSPAGPRWQIRPVNNIDGTNFGLAAWRTALEQKEDPEQDRLTGVLVELGAAAIARARLSNAEVEIIVAAKTG
jgi:K+-sensing histidine kinase KdpD